MAVAHKDNAAGSISDLVNRRDY